jgi:non-specific serine/threonine protein kinase
MDPSIVPESPVVAELTPDGIQLQTSFRDKELVKRIPGHKWNKNDRMWYLRRSWAAYCQLWGIFGERLQLGPQMMQWATDFKAQRVDPCMALRNAPDVPDWNAPWLYPRQKVGALFMYYAQNALMGDEVGSGKTRQIITALELKQAYPVVIVAPRSVKASWKEEFETLEAQGAIPHREVRIITGNATQRRKLLEPGADVYIIHWEIVRLHTRLAGYGNLALDDKDKQPKELNAIPYKSVIVDEGHRMQDPKAKQTRGIWWLGDHCPPDGLRICATGTPVERSCDDAWPQFRFIEPDEFPSKTAFIDRYALTSWNPFGFSTVAGLLPETKDEFFAIIDRMFIRRPMKVVVPGIPDPVRRTRRVELKGAQAKAYQTFRKELIAEVKDGVVIAKNPLTAMTRARQLAAATLQVTETGDVKLVEPSAVLDELMDHLAELGTERKAIIMAESRQLIELASARLAKAHYTHGLITGAVGEAERTAVRHAFQNNQLQHILLTVGAGGEGLTLTACTDEVWIERPFSLKKNKQGEGRGIRPGQESEVLITDIEPVIINSKGQEVPTVYGHVRETILSKDQNAEEILRDAQTINSWLAEEAYA